MSAVSPQPVGKIQRAIDQLGRDESGSIAILFALTALVVTAMVGGAIDFGRAVHARYQIQQAIDASVLAAARVWQTEQDITLAEQKASIHYASNKPTSFASEVSQFTFDPINNTISMQAGGVVPTPFLSILHVNGYTVSAAAQAKLKVEEESGKSVEVSLMLDVTGSMAGDKIVALKAAAKDFIDIVVWDDQSDYTSKVALVPFAEAINLGTSTMADDVRGMLRTGSCLTSSSPCTSFAAGSVETSLGWIWGKPATWYRFTRASGSDTYTYKVSDRCVTERTGAQAYTDAAPDTDERKLGPAYLGGTSSGPNCSMVDTRDAEVNSVQPLSNDKVMLKRRIDELKLAGSTAGQLGTAWAWYMLSPSWDYLWPSANRPKAYSESKLQKIAILMTDGEYNTMYCNGASAMNSYQARINCNATNGQAYSQARTLCTNMKAEGITVYTVGFQLGGSGSTSYQTLQQCASGPDKFFNAEDGVELRNSFRAIALQIAPLTISQ